MKTTKQQTRRKPLPHKLSALILVALADLAKAERSPKYAIQMEVWHVPNGQCTVCFAGSVMAFSLRVPSTDCRLPEDFGKHTKWAMLALNAVRKGRVLSAVSILKTGGSYGVFDERLAHLDRSFFRSLTTKTPVGSSATCDPFLKNSLRSGSDE